MNHLYRDLNESFTGTKNGIESENFATKPLESEHTDAIEEEEEEEEGEDEEGEEVEEEKEEEEEGEDEAEYLTPTEISIEFSIGGGSMEEEEDHNSSSAVVEMASKTGSVADDPVQLTSYKVSVV